MIIKCHVLIFDVDSTLAETEELNRKAFNRTFQKWYLYWYWDVETYKQLLKVSGEKERLNHYITFFHNESTLITQHQIVELHR